jgi:hypothetical protein
MIWHHTALREHDDPLQRLVQHRLGAVAATGSGRHAE